jgi:hypothetical protein
VGLRKPIDNVPVQCMKCGKEFKTNAAWKKHATACKSKFQTDNIIMFHCNKCGAGGFKTYDLLREHEYTHMTVADRIACIPYMQQLLNDPLKTIEVLEAAESAHGGYNNAEYTVLLLKAILEIHQMVLRTPMNEIIAQRYWSLGSYTADPKEAAMCFEGAIKYFTETSHESLAAVIVSYVETLKKCGRKDDARKWNAVMTKAAKLDNHEGAIDNVDVKCVKQAMEAAKLGIK